MQSSLKIHQIVMQKTCIRNNQKGSTRAKTAPSPPPPSCPPVGVMWAGEPAFSGRFFVLNLGKLTLMRGMLGLCRRCTSLMLTGCMQPILAGMRSKVCDQMMRPNKSGERNFLWLSCSTFLKTNRINSWCEQIVCQRLCCVQCFDCD